MKDQTMYRVIHDRTKEVLALETKLANSYMDRLVGLMFKKSMQGFDALLLEPCNSIHTFFMQYPIDVLFLDSSNQIVKIFKSLKPWRVTNISFKTRKVLELKAGVLKDNVQVGDKVEFECLS